MNTMPAYRLESSAMDGTRATEQEQARFFTQLQEGYATASARTGEVVRDFRVAGTSVRLRFAGEALIPVLVSGLAHPVITSEGEPGCEIRLWDSESTGVQLPPPPRPWKDFTERGNIWGFDSSRYRSAYQWGEGSVNVMDRDTRQAVFWVPSHQQLPAWVLASPLRSILHWWMELNGRQLVHGAGVGAGDCGVLIPGRGGSGKSSTSLACLLDGMDFIADDYLALALDPEPRMYQLYSTAKLDPRDLELHPELAARCRAVRHPSFDKVVLFLEDGYGGQFRESLTLKLVLKPEISGIPATILGLAEAADVERALASETIAHLPHVGPRTVELLRRVSREIPRATVHLGTDRPGVASAIREALGSGIAADSLASEGDGQRPFVTVIVHFREEQRDQLRTLAKEIDAQAYPRTEFIVIASGAACALAGEVRDLPGQVRFFRFKDAVINAEAWNRGIRESFAELVVVIEQGDRFPPGALDALVRACEIEPGAGWVRGSVVCSGPEVASISPLRGALIRKDAYRECGLFQADPFLQCSEHTDWLQRAEAKQLRGCQLDSVTLHVASPSAIQPCLLSAREALGFFKAELARRRLNKTE